MRNRLLMVALAVSLAQIAVLAWMIASRAALLQGGTEILLRMSSVARSASFDGTSFTVDFSMLPIPRGEVADLPADGVPDGTRLWLRLQERADGFFEPVSASLAPAQTAGNGEIDLEAFVRGDVGAAPFIPLRLPFEQVVLTQSEAAAVTPLEDGVGTTAARIAVGRDGKAQIKALLRDGRIVFQQAVL